MCTCIDLYTGGKILLINPQKINASVKFNNATNAAF